MMQVHISGYKGVISSRVFWCQQMLSNNLISLLHKSWKICQSKLHIVGNRSSKSENMENVMKLASTPEGNTKRPTERLLKYRTVAKVKMPRPH